MESGQIWIPLLLTLLAGLSTGIGSLFALFVGKPKISYMCVGLGLSTGVMIYVSFVELLGSAIDAIGFLHANLAFFGGIIFLMIIDFLVPHNYIYERVEVKTDTQKKFMKAGIYTAIGLAIHNFPEGIAVFASALNDLSVGIPLAFAIAIHNIPEGIAVAVPIYYATRNKAKAFWYSFISGIAEPVGALIGIIIFLPYLNDVVLNYILAFVGGVMVFITFDELLPLSLQNGKSHLTVIGIFSGMAIMAVSLVAFY